MTEIDYNALIQDLKKIVEHCKKDNGVANATLTINATDFIAKYVFSSPCEEFATARIYSKKELTKEKQVPHTHEPDNSPPVSMQLCLNRKPIAWIFKLKCLKCEQYFYDDETRLMIESVSRVAQIDINEYRFAHNNPL